MPSWLQKTWKTFLQLRPHFFAALAMFLLIAYMSQEPDKGTRTLLIAPVFALFVAFIVFLVLEYEAVSQKK